MGSSELTLDYKPTTAHQSLLYKALGDHPDHAHKLEEFVARLEEERLKIDAFKRELPLCMLLLNNAMETYKQQLEASQTSTTPRPVLEEFIPLKNMDTDGEKAAGNGSVPEPDKVVWMASEQLWRQQADGETGKNREKDNIVHAFNNTSPKLGLDNMGRKGGVFLPFKDKGKTASAVTTSVVHELVLVPSEKDVESNKNDKVVDAGLPARMDHAGQGGSCGQGADVGKAPGSVNQQECGAAAAPQTQRKARRCWSPDLHRRFVNALQMLGGSQVATPKQIRELMKVDGLTNDEVKSHLQKYRLHTRRPAPAPPSTMAAAGPQVVVVGGIWVPPEYATAGTALYTTHPGSAAHYCPAGPVPQEFYAPHHLRHHMAPPHPMAVHHRGTITPFRGTCSSPESEGKCGGRSESMEDREEGTVQEEGEDQEERKSDGWKGGEEKAQEDDGDVSHDGDAALKF